MIKKLLTLLCAGLLIPAFSQDTAETNEVPVPIVGYTATLKSGDKVQLSDAETVNEAINQIRRNITSLKTHMLALDAAQEEEIQVLRNDLETTQRILIAINDRFIEIEASISNLNARIDSYHSTNVIPPVQEFSEIGWNNGAVEVRSYEVVGSELTPINEIDPSFVHFVQARPLSMPEPVPAGILPESFTINLVTYPEVDAIFKGWKPEVPEFVPATNCTFNAVFENQTFYNLILKYKTNDVEYVVLNNSFLAGESIESTLQGVTAPGYSVSFHPPVELIMPSNNVISYLRFMKNASE